MGQVSGRSARSAQVNVRLNTEERRILDKLAKHERRTPADTVRILIVRAGAALRNDDKTGVGGASL
jgi:hypothetical protein